MINEETWITTYTGKKFHFANPTPEEIDIADIAHALALSTRFRGHSRVFYSVAEHSIRVADIFKEPRLRLYALLHDAAETYLPDIPTPLKRAVKLDVVEEKILTVIHKKFHLLFPVPPREWSLLKLADWEQLRTEALNLLPNVDGWDINTGSPSEKIYPWTWQEAERRFLETFVEIISTGEIK